MTTGRLPLKNIRDSLDSDIQIYMKLKEKIMEKAKSERKYNYFFEVDIRCPVHLL